MNDAQNPPNFVSLGRDTFLCRTQAGFKQAAKQWTKSRYLDRKVTGKEADWLQGSSFPTHYPAIVSFSDTRHFLTLVSSWSGTVEVKTWLTALKNEAARDLDRYSKLLDTV